jgi:indolepyruvate ferredoxin oxidoreductase alpha subunit
LVDNPRGFPVFPAIAMNPLPANSLYLMGNAAIGRGAVKAGVSLACGYPGTPSSEILSAVAEASDPRRVHVEWSVNEKAAMEIAAGAAYAGARTLVTMKMVGLNVASDPLMSLAYVGVKGALVVVSADDPGPISSQTEQDSRAFGDFARIPVFDPATPEEAYEMIQDAFACSEKWHTPVLFRPTTRVCHAYAAIPDEPLPPPPAAAGFEKDSLRWVIFPKFSRMAHEKIERRNPEIGKEFSAYRFQSVEGSGRKAVFAGGVSWAYAKDCLASRPADAEPVRLVRIATPHPFPDDFALAVLRDVDEVLAFEELSPYIERELLRLAGQHHLAVRIRGKLTGDGILAGENGIETARQYIGAFLGDPPAAAPAAPADGALAPPPRPPVLCAGCPHRAAFYAVKRAMRGKKAFFCGDIGCYTLGNAAPLEMTDTCLCMGAGVTIAQGLARVEPDATAFAFTGDSTFFASGITGVTNAVYNGADEIVCVLDNSTTAMTGHQPHPGTGRTLRGDVAEKIDIEAVLRGVGVKTVLTVDPLDMDAAVKAVETCVAEKGVRAIVFRSPCVALFRPTEVVKTDEAKCIGCKKCIKEIGCPAIRYENKKAVVDPAQCNGCGLCTSLCPVGALAKEARK